MAIAAWVVVVAVDREDGNSDIDVGILVVDKGKGSFKDFGSVTEKLEFAWLHAEAVFAKRAHDLVHGFARGFVLMEEITTQQDHVDVLLLCYLHDLVKGTPTVILADGVALRITDVVIGRDEDADRVRLWSSVSKRVAKDFVLPHGYKPYLISASLRILFSFTSFSYQTNWSIDEFEIRKRGWKTSGSRIG